MGNLSAIAKSPVVEKIEEWWKTVGSSEAPRRYLGASVIGHECDRYLWLYFRGLLRDDFDGRMYRLFDRGRREEDVFVRELRGIGCEVWPVDTRTGGQWAVSAVGGHFAGHLDGVARGIPGAEKTPHVLEFKTHSAASFAKLEKSGVKIAKPQHYAQMQVYMGLMKLTRALYLAVNKDTDAEYAERVEFDRAYFGATMDRAKRIIEGDDAEPCASRPDDWRCKFCPGRAICWPSASDDRLTTVPRSCAIDCRTCWHAAPVTDGNGARWTCKLGMACSIGQPCRCDFHLLLPGIVRAKLECFRAETGTVEYKLPDGTVFANGGCAISSEEMRDNPKSVVLSPEVQACRTTFPGAHIVQEKDVFSPDSTGDWKPQ